MTASDAGPSVREIFSTLEYGPAPESHACALAWLDTQDRLLGHYVNGKWLKPEDRNSVPCQDPVTGENLASCLLAEPDDVAAAVKAALEVLGSWSRVPGAKRAQHLTRLAKMIQKHQRLLWTLDSLVTGRAVREIRDRDVLLAQQLLQYQAVQAQVQEEALAGWKPMGVIGLILPPTFSFLEMMWRICPALAVGRSQAPGPRICVGGNLQATPDQDGAAKVWPRTRWGRGHGNPGGRCPLCGPVLCAGGPEPGCGGVPGHPCALSQPILSPNIGLGSAPRLTMRPGRSALASGRGLLFPHSQGGTGSGKQHTSGRQRQRVEREAGAGTGAGLRGLYEYLQPSGTPERLPFEYQDLNYDSFGLTVPVSLPAGPETGPSPVPPYGLFVGGRFQPPGAWSSRPIWDSSGNLHGYVAEGGAKDVRGAVEAAHQAAAGWEHQPPGVRATLLVALAAALERRGAGLAERLQQHGADPEAAKTEVELSAGRLRLWAAYAQAQAQGHTLQVAGLKGPVLRLREPLGVLAIVCPDEWPLLAFVSLLAPALAHGNAVVLVPSRTCPLLALEVCQDVASMFPAGLVNVVTGDCDHLTRCLALHQDVQALWYFGSAKGSQFVEWASAGNLKPVWVNRGHPRAWDQEPQGTGSELALRAARTKALWLPMGD